VLVTPARPAFLLSLVAFLPAPPLAVDFLLKLTESFQIRLAPKPYSPAVTYAQLRGLKLSSHDPPVQGHYRNTRGFGGLLRVTGFCHTVIYIPHLL
jgi:hypothetical protein